MNKGADAPLNKGADAPLFRGQRSEVRVEEIGEIANFLDRNFQ